MKPNIYIVGGGHAGVEAAFAVSRLGLKCTIITMDMLTDPNRNGKI